MSRNTRGIIQILFNYIVVCLFVFLNEVFKNQEAIYYFKIVALMLMAFNIILYCKKEKLQKADIIILLHTLYVVILTMLFGASIVDSLTSIMVFPVLFIYFDRTIKRNASVVDVIYYGYLTYLIICVFAHLFFENPLIVGGKNQLSLIFIPLIFFAVIHSYKKHGKLSVLSIVIIATSSLLVFMHRSGTGTVAMFLALLSLCLLRINIPTKKLKMCLLICFVLAAITLLSLPVLSENYYVRYFIENVLSKDSTMSGRMDIWNYAIEKIKHSPFGYGYNNTVIKDVFHNVNVSACHNSILEILMIGGVPLLIIYVGLIKNSLKNNQRNKLVNFSYAMLFAISINGLTESIPYNIGLWFIILAIKNLDFRKMEANRK